MVNTRSQKRRGMPKRATRKNLKNRNAQTKRRGQQKGGNPSNEEVRVRDEPLFASRNAVLKIELELIPNAIGNLVFDFDKTLTKKHSNGHPMKWVRKNTITEAFGRKLQELIIKLGKLKEARYNLFLNSRGSRSELIDFFITTGLIEFIPENNIFGASDNSTSPNDDTLPVLGIINKNEPANSYDEVGIGGRYDTKNWAKQKLRYLRRILKDTNNLPTKFYDDTFENIQVVERDDIHNLESIRINPPGLVTTLGLLNELVVEEDPLPPPPPSAPPLSTSAPPMSTNEQPPTPPERGTMALHLRVNNIKGDTEDDKYKNINDLFKKIYKLINNPDKRILIDTKRYPKATSKLEKINFRHFSDEIQTRPFKAALNMKNSKMHEKFITHKNIIDVLNGRTDKRDNINYKSMDDKLIVTYDIDGIDGISGETKHLQDIIKDLPPSYSNSIYNRAVGNYPPPPPYSEGGRRKSKSKSKTKTKKSRATNAKNKRTRKSKK